MSYANGTAHYNLPQTVGTDKRDWFDTNSAFADVDAALYGVVEQNATDHTDIAAMKLTIANLQQADVQFQRDLSETNGRVTTLEQNAATDEAAIDDLADMFCPLEVATAQSDIDVAQGRMFRYNGVLYIATAAIAIGDTIVPNTNCVATNMEEELSQINTALSKHHKKVAELVTDGTITNADALWNISDKIANANLTEEQLSSLVLWIGDPNGSNNVHRLVRVNQNTGLYLFRSLTDINYISQFTGRTTASGSSSVVKQYAIDTDTETDLSSSIASGTWRVYIS